MAGKVYTTQQVANILGVHKNTILNWIKSGKVPEPRRDWKQYRQWTERDLQALRECKNKYLQLSLDINEQ